MNMIVNSFLEAAHTASIIPMESEATLYAMKSFGGFDITVPVIAAIAGGILGHVFNWWLGKLLMRLPSSPKEHPTYLKIQYLFNRYAFFLLFFAFAPLMNIVVIASGMLGTSLKKVLPLIALGVAWHYGSLLV